MICITVKKKTCAGGGVPHHYTGGSSPFFIGASLKVCIFKYSCGKYASSATCGCNPTCLASLWKEIGKAIMYSYTHGNPYNFSPGQIATLSGAWQCTWGNLPPGMGGIRQPSCVIQWLPCDGKAPPPLTPSPTATSTSAVCTCPCTKHYQFPLNKFFQPDGQARVLLWETI
jgi:hypothetical protein